MRSQRFIEFFFNKTENYSEISDLLQFLSINLRSRKNSQIFEMFFVKILRSQIYWIFFSINLRIIPRSQIYYSFLSINLIFHYFSKYNYKYLRFLNFFVKILRSQIYWIFFVRMLRSQNYWIFFSINLRIMSRSQTYYNVYQKIWHFIIFRNIIMNISDFSSFFIVKILRSHIYWIFFQ